MTAEPRIVRVTRRGQTTVPKEFREAFGIEEGDFLLFEETEGGMIVRPLPKLEDLAGIDAEHGSPAELKERLEALREEYD
ncbi:MAG: AbrB/MazE/SpoVT family DNA-binding domain-containing protein [Thermoplasmata archaeon]